MNPFLTQLLLQKKKNPGSKGPSRYQEAKDIWELKVTGIRLIKDVILIAAGIASATLGLESFILPNNLIDGGVTGISLLVAQIKAIPLPILLVVINSPFVFLGLKIVGREFALKTAIAITGLALSIALVHLPEVTHDKLLGAIFGGFFIGAGIGLSIRGGAVLDGTEVLAIFLSKQFHTTIGDFIIVFNVIIFSFAAYLLSMEQALYSMITYLAASKTLDFVVEGIEEYSGITIISSHFEDIRLMIINKLGRGVTVYKGRGGYGKRGELREMDILYTVITRLEISKLNTEIEKIDPNAFVVTSSVKDTKGGMIKRRPLEH